MLRISSEVKRELVPFWNHALFHPTDAIEDSWGKRIIDRMAKDGAIKSLRIYAMLEDIVYMDEDDKLCYDFRVSDTRLDYLVSQGFDLLIAYAGIPECIARREFGGCSVAKGKTRYKGKMFNTNLPTDFALWEEVCFQYTKHNIERYGLDVVSRWHLQCWNEPDCKAFFMNELDDDEFEATRIDGYCKLYDAFIRGAERASKNLLLGGPAFAYRCGFFRSFLKYVKESGTRIDFISVHIYGTSPDAINAGEKAFTVRSMLEKYEERAKIIKECGFGHLPILIDEWGLSSHGFFNIEECPVFIARESEVFSAYFAKLITEFVDREYKTEMLMICLSGQHEMVTDFTGFRNFFTLNFMAKPIYNAHLISSFLKKNLVSHEGGRENLHVLPTKDSDGSYSVLLSYSSDYFDDDIESYEEEVVFDGELVGKRAEIFVIDKTHTNPYRAAERMGKLQDFTKEEILALREEGKLKALKTVTLGSDGLVSLKMTPNCTYLIRTLI